MACSNLLGQLLSHFKLLKGRKADMPQVCRKSDVFVWYIQHEDVQMYNSHFGS